MTLLTIVQEATEELGIQVPDTVVGNTDAQVVQLLALTNRAGRELARRGGRGWNSMVREATFTFTTGTQDQGAIQGTIVTDSDFKYFISDTMWDRTTSLPITGPLDSVSYQTLQAFPVTGPYYQYMFREDGHLYIDPAPASADTVAFDYMSKAWCEDSGGTARTSDKFEADSDVSRLDEDLITMALKWRWLRAKRLDYSEEFADYERAVMDSLGKDGGKPILNIESSDRDYRKAGIIVPIGSWNV